MTAPAPEVIEREKDKLYVTDAELIRRFRFRLMDRWGVSLEEWTSAKRFSPASEFTECLGLSLAHWELLVEADDLPRGQVRWGQETWERDEIIFRLGQLRFVYFAGLHDFVKIGYSAQTDIRHRLASIETSIPYSIDLIHYMAGSLRTERLLHAKFSETRHIREWFKRTDNLMGFIEALKS